MKIAVASGKGGTGKTMLATSLAASLAPHAALTFLDCDVEAPNAHLFLRPEIEHQEPVNLPIPEIDADRCSRCGLCVTVCRFNALAKIGDQILVFPQLCHGCGACSLACPEDAIREVDRPIGTLSTGQTTDGMAYRMGELNIGEPMPTPVIRAVKDFQPDPGSLTIIDCPPGASCSVVAAIHDADFLILVTEPTPFGWHDLTQMLGVIEKTGTPAGLVINRDGIGDDGIDAQLEALPIPILLRIPFQDDIAAALARGQLLIEALPDYQPRLHALYDQIRQQVNRDGAL
ncbi:ATP-binding protein [bacterium]|nr:ATP-binding protein [bacterium]